jgi:hypothetical protein
MTTRDKSKMTYFSFVEPWGYEDSIEYFTKREKNIEWNGAQIYFHRELLGYSKEMRYVELITITGPNLE